MFDPGISVRKETLGEIWRAATMSQEKFNQKFNQNKLGKINILEICEDILNPPVPLALRLSATYMYGVVKVYQRKVKFLLDDANRTVAEIKRVRKNQDPTLLPKGKTEAREKDIAWPDSWSLDEFSITQSSHDSGQRFHQANLEEITEEIKSFETSNETSFERFDDELQGAEIPPQQHQDHDGDIFADHMVEDDNRQKPPKKIARKTIPTHTFDDICKGEKREVWPEEKVRKQMNMSHTPLLFEKDVESCYLPQILELCSKNAETLGFVQERIQNQRGDIRQQPPKKRAKKMAASMMDDDYIISNDDLQSWSNPSDIMRKLGGTIRPKRNIRKQMNMPATLLLFEKDVESCYPPQLLELCSKSTQLIQTSSPGNADAEPPVQNHDQQDPHQGSDLGRPPTKKSRKTQTGKGLAGSRASFEDIDHQAETEKQPCSNGSEQITEKIKEKTQTGKGLLGLLAGSRASFEDIDHQAETEKQPCSNGSEQITEKIKEKTQTGKGLLAEDIDHQAETEKQPCSNGSEQITEKIKATLKAHFDEPGGPQVEYLNNLSSGFDRNAAAQLFYQTCVLATRGAIKVNQTEPYGDIQISRGTNM